MSSDKNVYLLDGVPLGFATDISLHLAGLKHKQLIIKKSSSEAESEFEKKIRKEGGDAYLISPTESSIQGINQMLDKGLGRYGRVTHIVFFKHLKDETLDTTDWITKSVEMTKKFNEKYLDYYHSKQLTPKSVLFITSSPEITIKDIAISSNSTDLLRVINGGKVAKNNWLLPDQQFEKVQTTYLAELV